eukprot:8028227-Karenia_brevis.AAC.1
MTYDPEFEFKRNLTTAKHVDDINMGGTEKEIDDYHAAVERVTGKCKINKRQYANCGVRHTLQQNHDVILDQDDYISTLRPTVHPEFTGAPAEDLATTDVCTSSKSTWSAGRCYNYTSLDAGICGCSATSSTTYQLGRATQSRGNSN